MNDCILLSVNVCEGPLGKIKGPIYLNKKDSIYLKGEIHIKL